MAHYGPLSQDEALRRQHARRKARRMLKDARAAFGFESFCGSDGLIVWTRSQMNGIRATIRRLRMVRSGG